MIESRVRERLDQLSPRLGDTDWLDGEFSAGDLLMIMVLRRLEGTNIVEGYPDLVRYIARGTAQSGYRRAFAAQRAVFNPIRELSGGARTG